MDQRIRRMISDARSWAIRMLVGQWAVALNVSVSRNGGHLIVQDAPGALISNYRIVD